MQSFALPILTKYSMNGRSQVIRGTEFNCVAAKCGAQHVLHPILQTLQPSKWKVNRIGQWESILEMQDPPI